MQFLLPKVTTEFRRYTELSLIAEIGGYVGLLMGYSLLNITKMVSPAMLWVNYVLGLFACTGDRGLNNNNDDIITVKQ